MTGEARGRVQQRDRIPLDQLDLLASVLAELTKSLDLEETLRRAVRYIKSHLRAGGASIFLLENEGRELVCRVCASDADITGVRMDADQGIIGRALRHGEAQIVTDTAKDPDFFQGVDQQSGADTASLLCAPMQVRGEAIGAIEVINKGIPGEEFDLEDVEVLSILAHAAGLAIQNARMAERLVSDTRTRHELELAREIQQSFLPRDDLELLGVAGITLPARMVSGDFYYYCREEDGRVLFWIGDVVGKGINASLMASHITALMRFLRRQALGPGELLGILNRELVGSAPRGFFTTMIAGCLDPVTGMVVAANAGHHPPVQLLNGGGQREHRLASPPLGVLAESRYEAFEVDVSEGPLYMFTDGLTECWTDRGTPLGVEGLEQMARAAEGLSPGQRLKEIVEKATAWKRGQSGFLHDDITLLVLDRPAGDRPPSGRRTW